MKTKFSKFSNSQKNGQSPLVGIVVGSTSDWDTVSHTSEVLTKLGVPHESRVVSAHRTPDLLFEYAQSATSRGIEVIIAGAGGAAHLPGMIAAKTSIPVLGVPIQSSALNGLDSLLSIVQMPGGIPVGTLAIGKAGAINAALLATSILGNSYPEYRKAVENFRKEQTESVLERSFLPPENDDHKAGNKSTGGEHKAKLTKIKGEKKTAKVLQINPKNKGEDPRS